MPTVHFLFPADPVRENRVDEIFADQYAAFRAAGFSCSLLPDRVLQRGSPLPPVPAGAVVIYRGWMLDGPTYDVLERSIEQADALVLTSTRSYLATHHLPNWYPLLKDVTPETYVLDKSADRTAAFRELGWDSYFVKDYVKSLKTSRSPIVHYADELDALVLEMERVRGVIEGGLCLRRVEPFRTETERRYFAINNQPFAPDDAAVPDLVYAVAERVPSRFFSIDTVLRTDGELRVVEIGDGQVSDLVGWSAERLAEVWRQSTSVARG